MGLRALKPDPTVLAPVGAYMTDGQHLVEVLESDHSGALGEDCKTGTLHSIEPEDLALDNEKRWRLIRMRSEAA